MMYIRLLFLIVLAFIAVGVFNNGPPRPKSRSDYIFPTTQIKYFTFGYSDTFADVSWLRVIQDFDVCTKPLAPPDAPRTGLNRQAHCELDWVYHMLETITTLSPRNYPPYAQGGLMLSVVLDDIKGASLIYEKGLVYFQKDWNLNYLYATHLMTETGDLGKAAFHYDVAVKNGAPDWIAALSAKLFSQTGRLELAITNLRQQIKSAPHSRYVDEMKKKLKELEEQLAARTKSKK